MKNSGSTFNQHDSDAGDGYAVQKANSGIRKCPRGRRMAYVLWTEFLRLNSKNPATSESRQVCALGRTLGRCFALPALPDGYDDFPIDLKQFRQWGSDVSRPS
ncbi:MAG: hypothetical protein IPL01_21140 [Acidobacteria bacterium]|nr:hypothetical protein [Acidobacteriota bacterium]